MTIHAARGLIEELRRQSGGMVEALNAVVSCESPSSDVDALSQCAGVLADVATEIVHGDVEVTRNGALPLVQVGAADSPIVLLGHLDTVHPMGTLEIFPFERRDGRLRGPGVFDMKAGLIQALYAMSVAGNHRIARLVVTADEEVGSPSSRVMIEEIARKARAVLVLEPSSGGRLKTARKGVSMYRLNYAGRAAHAGLEPERGANACMALAHGAINVAALADADSATTVTPTVASAGTSVNTVPDRACLAVDVRAASGEEQRRVDRAIRAMQAGVEGVTLEVQGGINRPPLPSVASVGLFAVAQRACEELGLDPVEGKHVGGGSDGNFAAAVGAPTLDGLGAVGGGAHTREEWVWESAMADRAALLARLIELISVTDKDAAK